MSSLFPADEVKRRVLSWAVKLRVNPKVVRIQRMRKKWGSCSPAGTITLASDLVGEDRPFQDYVIIHELLHPTILGTWSSVSRSAPGPCTWMEVHRGFSRR